MKKYLLLIVCYLCLLSFGAKSQVSTLLSWNTATGTSGAHLATFNDPNLEIAVLSRGPSLTYNNSSSNSYVALFPIGQDKAAAKAGAYFEVTIKAKPGYFVSLSAIDAILRRASTTSPGNYRWAYSIDGVNFTEVGSDDVFISRTAADNNNGEVQPTIDLGNVMDLQYVPSTTTITLRLYAWGATAAVSSSNFGIGKFTATTPSLIFKGFVVNTAPVQYTVTFDSKGGTPVAAKKQFNNLQITPPVEPTRTDYVFAGWYKDEAYTALWDFSSDIVSGDITLYAKWNDPRQTINFPAIADIGYGSAPFELTATATSGLPITYEALTSNISITGTTVTILNTGPATIRATQLGNADYNAATPVEVSFNVVKGTQTISFENPGPFSRYAGEATLTATSSSGLPVTFSAYEPTVALLTDDNKLIIKGLGTIKVTASQAGNELYLPASPVEQNVLIQTAGKSQLLVIQALSPNGDGINDVFIIEGIKAYPENQLKIVNRSGQLVYEQKGYNNEQVVFAGKSNGGDKLPDGTYYYSLAYKQNNQWVQKKGYLFIKN